MWLASVADDVLNGGLGADSMDGQRGDDKLFGGKGNDDLEDFVGNDHIWRAGQRTICLAGLAMTWSTAASVMTLSKAKLATTRAIGLAQ